MLENKVDRYNFALKTLGCSYDSTISRYMAETAKHKPRLGIGFFGWGKEGWTSPYTGITREPNYEYPLPYDGAKPEKEWKF